MAKNLLNLCLRWNKVLALNYNHLRQLSYTINSTSHRCPNVLWNKTSKLYQTSNYTVDLNSQQKPNNITNKYLDRLKEDQKIQKRVNYKVLQESIEFALKNPLDTDDAVFLLRICTRSLDPSNKDISDTIDAIWNAITIHQMPDKYLVKELIKSYQKIGRKIDDTQAFLDAYKLNVDSDLLEQLLWLACESEHNSEGIVKILTEIKQKDFPLTLTMFNALILGHSRNKDIPTCEKVLNTISLANLHPDSVTYTELIRAYIENKEFQLAWNVLRERCKLLSHEEIFSLIRTATIYGAENILDNLLQLLPADVIGDKRISAEMQSICLELMQLDKHKVVNSLIGKMPIPSFNDNEDLDVFGGFIIDELVRRNIESADVVEFCNQLKTSGRNSRAMHICCESALRNDSPYIMHYLTELAQSEPLRPHYFWPMIIRSYAVRGETGILDILDKMKTLKVPVDHDTILQFILPKVKTLKDPQMIMRKLEEHGVKTNQIQLPLILFLILNSNVGEAINILKTYQSKMDVAEFMYPLIQIALNSGTTKKSAHSLGVLLKLLSEKSLIANYDIGGQILIELSTVNPKKFSFQAFANVVEQFFIAELRISRYACDILLQYISNCNDTDLKQKTDEILRKMWDNRLNVSTAEELGTTIAHPRDMNLEELECHLIELRAKNMNARGILRRILQLAVRAGKYHRAFEVKKMCEAENVSHSPGMLASIFDLMVKSKNVDKSYKALDHLKQTYPTFTIDEHKIIDFTALLVENNKLADAKAMLEKHASDNRIRGGANVLKNVWQLLTNVAVISAQQNCKSNQTKEFLDFLIQLGYCDYHNTLLGPIIREYFLKSEYKAAVGEFIQIATNKRKTPLHYEIIAKMIEISNAPDAKQTYNLTALEAKTLLQEVIKCTAKVHGVENTNVSLVVAFAEYGTENQLRKLLIDPSIQINTSTLIKQCQYLSGSGAITTLLKLAKCCRGLNLSIKEQDLHEMLLNQFDQKNDCDSAVALFEKIIEYDEFKVTSDFARKLKDLLERNNLLVPASVKLHAKLI